MNDDTHRNIDLDLLEIRKSERDLFIRRLCKASSKVSSIEKHYHYNKCQVNINFIIFFGSYFSTHFQQKMDFIAYALLHRKKSLVNWASQLYLINIRHISFMWYREVPCVRNELNQTVINRYPLLHPEY